METVSADAAPPADVGATTATHVTPLPPDFLTWPRFKWACGALLSLAVTGLLLCAALLPFIALLAAGVWAAVTFVYEIPSLGDRFRVGDFPAVMRDLSTLDLAGRTGFFSASYFLMLLALVVFFVGLLGRRRQHFYLIPGVVLTVLGVGAFIVAAQFLFASLHLAPLTSTTSRRLVVSYIALDTAVLAALLADLGPSRRARRRRARERERLLRMAQGEPARAITPDDSKPPAVAAMEVPRAEGPERPGDAATSAAAPAPETSAAEQVGQVVEAAADVPAAEHALAPAAEASAIAQTG